MSDRSRKPPRLKPLRRERAGEGVISRLFRWLCMSRMSVADIRAGDTIVVRLNRDDINRKEIDDLVSDIRRRLDKNLVVVLPPGISFELYRPPCPAGSAADDERTSAAATLVRQNIARMYGPLVHPATPDKPAFPLRPHGDDAERSPR